MNLDTKQPKEVRFDFILLYDVIIPAEKFAINFNFTANSKVFFAGQLESNGQTVLFGAIPQFMGGMES